MATFPTSVRTWSPTDTGFYYPEDLKTIVYARHVTTIYDEVTAIETELGAGGLKTSVVDNATAFNSGTSGNVWSSLKTRLANMEQGVLDGVNRRVKTSGGSAISSTSTTVGLSIQTSGTGNLLEIKNTSGDVVNKFNKDGFFNGVIDCGALG